MTTSLQPLKLYGHRPGPNPVKVLILLNELSLPYTIDAVPFSEVKSPSYLSLNPNGRLPTLHDPNTGLTIWESGAIIEYLVDRYDTARRLSFEPGTHDFYLAKQWLHFQMSGQGPYYGQLVWFKKFHAEQVPSAVERYAKEVNRVTGVLEGWLEKQAGVYGEGDGPWLVGGKLSYADLAFVPWQRIPGAVVGVEDFDLDKFPFVKGWLERMMEREGVRVGVEGEKE
ncbi:glutathione S-transferase Ure2-like protein [Aspergillus pseudotamarii]|uniref:Glutathione S-transferase Ure2-like protein n=1 Tax=Aspergillus pseudotamarii TaxID=132259 RepID=A0A5N6SQ71_ASPPS|nr:glutathione S-transferase Ure2-like protein [Aspergillus pseudotamarii]KAE8136057.1 glutathione S-transferase Ure2-like protein [Aspergillus pseudotamarii]